ncbi:MAG: hypothetical protein QW397_04970, partial [Fervidicoccaceae archaeon]
YVYNQSGSLIASGQSGSITISSGQVQQISASLTLSGGNTITPGKVYTIKVVAPTGASAIISVTAHS